MSEQNPLVVQADRTILLEVHHPRYAEARVQLARFAELEKSPEHIHFYRLHPISIWNAAALGVQLEEILGYLVDASRYPVAPALLEDVRRWYGRYGVLHFVRNGTPGQLLLHSDDRETLREVCCAQSVRSELSAEPSAAEIELEELDQGWAVAFGAEARGRLKQALMKLGYPVEDRAGYREGASMEFALRESCSRGGEFALRPYQEDSARGFWAGGSDRGGCGVIVLPCGAGKTVVGIGVMNLLQTRTLILTANTVAVRQWKSELLDKTTLGEEMIGEYTGQQKQVRPVTIATYQILTYRRNRTDPFVHFGLLDENDWGLIIYDEVHLLPAPVFRATAEIQARRRLGLTATLVREDGKEDEVFSLIGPKRYDMPWKELERTGFLARARCIEVRVPFSAALRRQYTAAGARNQYQIASTNPGKLDVVGRLLRRHAADRVLIIGQYLAQLRDMATVFGAPLITGKTPVAARERLYSAFRSGEIDRLIVSKVGNFAIDLPDAGVAIQVSGTFGSRQEEAQRLGRILRPKTDGSTAAFYSLVTEASRDQELSAKRQLFLTEQGYSYEILGAEQCAEA